MPKPSQVQRVRALPPHLPNLVWLRFPLLRRPHMAKGRKLTASRNDRFLGSSYAQSSSAAADASELREEDLWSTTEDHDLHVTVSPGEWEPSVAPRRSREDHHHRHHQRHVGGLSLAFDDLAGGSNGATSSRIVHQYRAQHDGVSSARGRNHVAASAPVNVPDWSKILRVESVESLHDMDDGFDDENNGESEMVPPHEYLARSRKMAANSVFEGVGRTLKGRDMRRVRDAVWSQTGFCD